MSDSVDVSVTSEVSAESVAPAAEPTVEVAEPFLAAAPAVATTAGKAPASSGPRVLGLPATRGGWWAFALETVFVVLFVGGAVLNSASMQTALWGRLGVVNRVLLVLMPIALLISLIGGVLAIAALARRRERSVLVWFAAAVFVIAAVVVVLSII